MTDNIPTTNVIRHWVAWSEIDADGNPDMDYERARLFDLWLEAHDAEIKGESNDR